MYTNYGKSCRSSKKSSSEEIKDSEKVEEVSTEDALGEEEDALDKANAEGYAGEDGGGAEFSSDNIEKETENETEEYHEGSEGAENTNGAENVDGTDGAEDGEDKEGNEDGENMEELGSEDKVEGEGESSSEDLEDEEQVKKTKKPRGPLEYDLKNMYPEMNVLIQKKKKEWDYQDPDIIRALWLESKTNVLSEWKVRNAKINTGKPSIEVRENVTVTLRQEHLKNKAELQKALEERDFEMTETTREPPHFESIQLATNLTTEMRYKYNRNNPPVPSNYVEHFEKYKKPPFKNIPNTLTCKL